MTNLHVGVALFDQGNRILLVRQNYGRCLWSLPGGAVEEFESPTEAAVRETLEESGCRVCIRAFSGAYFAQRRNMLSLVFVAELIDIHEWEPSTEIAETGYFGEGELPSPMSERMQIRIADAYGDQRGVFREDTLE